METFQTKVCRQNCNICMAESCHNLVTTLGVTTWMVTILSISGNFDPISAQGNVFAIYTFKSVAVIAGGHLVIIVTY